MATQHLQAAVTAAAVGASQRSVILTACDENCMKAFFETWMNGIHSNRDGDFSASVIVVGIGRAAYAFCRSLQSIHGHQCVLDNLCLPPNAPDPAAAPASRMGFRHPMYFLALLQKLTWAELVNEQGVGVLWCDMDVFLFGNPLKFITTNMPDADFVIQSEFWDATNIFKGASCRVGPHAPVCLERRRFTQAPDHLDRLDSQDLSSGICCSFLFNGGLWLASPSAAGSSLLRMWRAAVFEDTVVRGGAWSGNAALDQDLLTGLVFNGRTQAPLFTWNAEQRQYQQTGEVTRDPAQETIRVISAQIAQSHCGGPCGWKRDNTPFHLYSRGCRDVPIASMHNHLCNRLEDPGSVEPGAQRVCVMPQHSRDRMLSFHHNCIAQLEPKRLAMMSWLNWTVDEGMYEREVAEGGVRKKVFPEW